MPHRKRAPTGSPAKAKAPTGSSAKAQQAESPAKIAPPPAQRHKGSPSKMATPQQRGGDKNWAAVAATAAATPIGAQSLASSGSGGSKPSSTANSTADYPPLNLSAREAQGAGKQNGVDDKASIVTPILRSSASDQPGKKKGAHGGKAKAPRYFSVAPEANKDDGPGPKGGQIRFTSRTWPRHSTTPGRPVW
eukprot:SAG31_NODE_1825_length_7188_cov_5.401326_4_plen_192_part_00